MKNVKIISEKLKNIYQTFGTEIKQNQKLSEIMDRENLDQKNFIKIISESQILKSDDRKKMPDFTPILNGEDNIKHEHKRFRDQKSK